MIFGLKKEEKEALLNLVAINMNYALIPLTFTLKLHLPSLSHLAHFKSLRV